MKKPSKSRQNELHRSGTMFFLWGKKVPVSMFGRGLRRRAFFVFSFGGFVGKFEYKTGVRCPKHSRKSIFTRKKDRSIPVRPSGRILFKENKPLNNMKNCIHTITLLAIRRAFLTALACIACAGIGAQTPDAQLFHGLKPRNIGPAGMSGRVTAIDVVRRDMDQIYIGSAAGGIFKSENAGHTWTPVFDHEKAASIGAIAIYQKNPDIIYVGTGEGNPRNSANSGYGMYKSMDGGETWQPLGLELTRQIHRVVINPDNPDEVVVGAVGAAWGASEHRGIYRTTDGGQTWQKVLYLNDRTGCADLVVDPYNPKRMLAAMWEHRRDPWFFTSGGPHSGIYRSLDGGQTWEKVTQGLPTGDLGRIGLSFAPSKQGMVYAFVESKDNAIFRSEDGGKTWSRRSKPKDGNIGNRPFYYADIYVDVKNENRVYSIATVVTVSEDGGKTWSVFAPGNKIHTDHHAWWGHPDDPDFIMIGHDGGLNITHDRGKNWWFAENLPLGQFYHVNVDMDTPYNVYGGLQDNGSWGGPSQTWFKGGIRNMYWQRLSVGDGFDVIPDPLNPDYGYAMGQAGNLVRYHKPSGQLLKIKPVHPDGEYLRFNWNAGIAINPHDKKTIYYGSQYLHKSSDYGQSWEIISPDLTTNDPEKQKWLESGGLTYDVTGAEFHTTIITIAPSPKDEKVIWVGTDDGNVQLTRDGGASWTNCIDRIKGVPPTTWVTQITASPHNAAEAFVVFDDHRRNNWEPYIYRTRDYGKTWQRLVTSDDVWGYALSFVPDPVEPNLYFCGTEFGLYYSFDAGKTWQKWTNGLPTTPVQDLVIHPRDHDLVIATFGRAFWILDDIRPLREMAARRSISEDSVYLFSMPDAILAVIGESKGYRHGKIGDALYNGENRAYGALISFYLKAGQDPALKNRNAGSPARNTPEKMAKIEIRDAQGDLVRTLYAEPWRGVNRINWELDRDAPRNPNQPKPARATPPRGTLSVPPGNYDVTVSYQGQSAHRTVRVVKDPRLDISDADIAAKNEWIKQHLREVEQLTGVMDEIREMRADLNFLKKKLKSEQDTFPADLKTRIESVEKQLKGFEEQVLGKQVQGIYRKPEVLVNQLYNVRSYLGHVLEAPSPNQALVVRQTSAHVAQFLESYRAFRSGEWAAFKKAAAGGRFLFAE
ncbi:MAG: hypothetical protein D6714_15090 [Bacteroidetes bacterium]|nr:MAG: hypothetical protein D6714_15090 [Bacteroidota bacterium]